MRGPNYSVTLRLDNGETHHFNSPEDTVAINEQLIYSDDRNCFDPKTIEEGRILTVTVRFRDGRVRRYPAGRVVYFEVRKHE